MTPGVLQTLAQRLAILFAVAVLLNFPWELAQAGLFVQDATWGNTAWHCFVASLGDGLILWAIYGVGLLAFRRQDFLATRPRPALLLTLVTGVTVAWAVEAAALSASRWQYTDSMPILGPLRVGLTPMLQMVLLPPLALAIVEWAMRRLSPQPPGGGPRSPDRSAR